jgi:hypothetical protein
MNEPEFDAAVARYLEIQAARDALENERRELADRLGEHLASLGASRFERVLGSRLVAITRRETVRVRYDEELLRARLGERYGRILAFDPKKAKTCSDRLREWLGDRFAEVGTPDREKVRDLIESGEATAREFSGAFHREVRSLVTVSARPVEGTPED